MILDGDGVRDGVSGSFSGRYRRFDEGKLDVVYDVIEEQEKKDEAVLHEEEDDDPLVGYNLKRKYLYIVEVCLSVSVLHPYSPRS